MRSSSSRLWMPTSSRPKPRCVSHVLISSKVPFVDQISFSAISFLVATLIGQAEKFLASDAFTSEVQQGYRQASSLGISGVPFTVIDGKYAVEGAQPPEVFAEVRSTLSCFLSDDPSRSKSARLIWFAVGSNRSFRRSLRGWPPLRLFPFSALRSYYFCPCPLVHSMPSCRNICLCTLQKDRLQLMQVVRVSFARCR